MSTEMIIDTRCNGYVFAGWAAGRFQTDRGEMMPYANMFVLSPVSSYESKDSQASGMKAEKKKCLSLEVWNGLKPGDRVKLFFDDKKRVVMAALDQQAAPNRPGVPPGANRGAQPTDYSRGALPWRTICRKT